VYDADRGARSAQAGGNLHLTAGVRGDHELRAAGGDVTLYTPALPQHQSASVSGITCSSGIAASSARGCFWMRCP
jgi:uncharacterized RmlC-like cupin family protein